MQGWPYQLYPPNDFTFNMPDYNRSTHAHLIERQAQLASMHTTVVTTGQIAPQSLIRFDFETEHECKALGLPRFASRSELPSQWARYFQAVYGEVPPHEAFPLCVSQLSRLYLRVAAALNITLPPLAEDVCEPDGKSLWRPWASSKEPGWMVYLLHYKPPRAPLPNHTWVEVTHRARSWVSGFERAGLWFSAAGGTGVWANTGRTVVFNHHHEAFDYFGALWETDLALHARAAGYDTVQFIMGDSQWHPCCKRLRLKANCFGLELLSTRLVGNFACGGANSTSAFRAGWNADRPCACTEDNVGRTGARPRTDWYAGYLNCIGYASHCGSLPRLGLGLGPGLRSCGLPIEKARALAWGGGVDHGRPHHWKSHGNEFLPRGWNAGGVECIANTLSDGHPANCFHRQQKERMLRRTSTEWPWQLVLSLAVAAVACLAVIVAVSAMDRTL